MLVLLLGHHPRERALVLDARFADTLLAIHTPHRKWVHRYQGEAERADAVRAALEALSGMFQVACA